jgi:hypothetical protein
MVLAEGKVVGLDAASGRIVWQHDCPQAHGRLWIDGGRVLLGAAGPDGLLVRALELETGRPLWETPAGIEWAGGGKLYALDPYRTRVEGRDAATGRRDESLDLEIRLPRALRQHTPGSILLVSDTNVFLSGIRDASAGRCSLLCIERATGSVWGHSPPDSGQPFAPVLTATGFCYRDPGHVYGLARVGAHDH